MHFMHTQFVPDAQTHTIRYVHALYLFIYFAIRMSGTLTYLSIPCVMKKSPARMARLRLLSGSKVLCNLHCMFGAVCHACCVCETLAPSHRAQVFV